MYQTRKIKDYGEQELWAKPLISTMSGNVAMALLNRANQKTAFTLYVDSVGIQSAKVIHFATFGAKGIFGIQKTKK